MSGKKKYIIIFIVAALLIWMAADSFMQPGAAGLKGNFKEVAYVRNEQNTGPIVRVYAVSVADTLWNEMKDYGDYMPYNKYGVTRVYFFLDKDPVPAKLSADADNMEDEYKKYCIGRYEKNAMSQTYLSKYPFN